MISGERGGDWVKAASKSRLSRDQPDGVLFRTMSAGGSSRWLFTRMTGICGCSILTGR